MYLLEIIQIFDHAVGNISTISWIKNYHVLSCCFFFLDSMTCPIINHCMFTYPIMCLYLGSNVIVMISLKCRS